MIANSENCLMVTGFMVVDALITLHTHSERSFIVDYKVLSLFNNIELLANTVVDNSLTNDSKF